MTERDFCYWLQGYLELSNADSLDKKQTEEIKNHLKLVFTKKTPDLDIDRFLEDVKKQYPKRKAGPTFTCSKISNKIIC